MSEELLLDVTFPLAGVDLSPSYEGQRRNTTPTADNVRGHEPSTDRLRGGVRSGLARWGGEVPWMAFPMQELNFVTIHTAEALLDTYNYGDLPGEDPSQGVPDPSLEGWYHGPYRFSIPSDELHGLLDPPDFIPRFPDPPERPRDQHFFYSRRIRRRGSIFEEEDIRNVRDGGSAIAPSFLRGQPVEVVSVTWFRCVEALTSDLGFTRQCVQFGTGGPPEHVLDALRVGLARKGGICREDEDCYQFP